MTTELKKREWCYIHHPRVYDMAGCPTCGDAINIMWSEYVDHCWCPKCEIDYIPVNYGIFDGPIPLGVCALMGIKFDRIIIATHEVEIFNTETLKYPSEETVG